MAFIDIEPADFDRYLKRLANGTPPAACFKETFYTSSTDNNIISQVEQYSGTPTIPGYSGLNSAISSRAQAWLNSNINLDRPSRGGSGILSSPGPESVQGRLHTTSDCSAFVSRVLQDVGALEKGRRHTTHTLMTWKNAVEVNSIEEAIPGDIIIFLKNGTPVHTGIYMGNRKVIHMSTTRNDLVLADLDKVARNRTIKIRRVVKK